MSLLHDLELADTREGERLRRRRPPSLPTTPPPPESLADRAAAADPELFGRVWRACPLTAFGVDRDEHAARITLAVLHARAHPQNPWRDLTPLRNFS